MKTKASSATSILPVWLVTGIAAVLSAGPLYAQAADPAGVPEIKNWTAQQDHQNMKEQLGITKLRPGPSGQPNATNSANYDQSKANPFPDLPDVLTLKNGQKVTSADIWWKQRRPEIVEDFEREVIGRVPKNVPKVNWTVVTQIVDGVVGDIPPLARNWWGMWTIRAARISRWTYR